MPIAEGEARVIIASLDSLSQLDLATLQMSVVLFRETTKESLMKKEFEDLASVERLFAGANELHTDVIEVIGKYSRN